MQWRNWQSGFLSLMNAFNPLCLPTIAAAPSVVTATQCFYSSFLYLKNFQLHENAFTDCFYTYRFTKKHVFLHFVSTCIWKSVVCSQKKNLPCVKNFLQNLLSNHIVDNTIFFYQSTYNIWIESNWNGTFFCNFHIISENINKFFTQTIKKFLM